MIDRPDSQPFEPITRKRFTVEQAQELWVRTARRFRGSRARIRDARQLQQGALTIQREDWVPERPTDIDPLMSLHPWRKTLPLNLTSLLAKSEPEFKRARDSGSETANKRAEKTEQALREAFAQLVDWEEWVGKSVEDAEWALVGYPSAADFWQQPDFSEVIDESKVAVPTEERDDYDQGDDGKLRRPRKAYWRDRKGRAPEDEGYEKRDESKTRDAYDGAVKDHRARTLPFVLRLVPANDCAPIMVRGRGRERFRCAGLVVRSLYEEDDLHKQNYRWEKDTKAALIPRGWDSNVDGDPYGNRSASSVWLYEFFLEDDDGPFYATCVGMRDTWQIRRRDDGTEEQVEAVIDLGAEGIRSLMVHYVYGLRSAADEPDDRGVPFLDPFLHSILNIEAHKTAINRVAWKRGFSKTVISPDPSVPEAAYLDGQGNLKQPDIDPHADLVLLPPGTFGMLAPEQASPDIWRLIDLEQQAVLGNTVDPTVMGRGPSADQSGHSKALSERFAETSYGMIREGLRRAKEVAGAWILEMACAFERTHGVRVPVYGTEEVPPEEGGGRRDVILEFREDWIGDNYSVSAEYPQVGNLAEVEQERVLWKEGASTLEDVLEKRGKTNPWAEKIKIAADRWEQSPLGILRWDALAARARGDEEEAQRLELQAEGLLTEAGMPTAAQATDGEMMAAAQPAEPANAGMPLPSGASVRSGVIGGQRETGPMMQDAQAVAQAGP